MPANIILRNLTNPPKKAGESPKIATRSDLRDGVRGSGGGGGNTPGEFVFFSDFSGPEWSGANPGGSTATRFRENGDILPEGWDASRIEEGPSGWGIESAGVVTGNIPEASYAPGSKSYIHRRFSLGPGSTWNGDSTLSKSIPSTKKVYVEFRIRFSPGFTEDGSSKLFRVKGHKNTVEDPNWSNLGGGVIWSFSRNSYGMRNKVSIASIPTGWSSPAPAGLPAGANIQNGMDMSMNYTSQTYDLNGDGVVDNDPQITDLVSGGVIPNTALPEHSGYIATVPRLFGNAWRVMAFYLEMNSAPGVQDGKLVQWMDGSLIFRNTQMPWIQTSGDPDSTFNAVMLGGNDFFQTHPAEDQVMEWVAYDYCLIRDSLPEGIVI